MRELPENSVDLVVTSPPYNLGAKYNRYKDERRWDDYMAWSLTWAEEVQRVLKEDGSFFLNLGACPSEPLLPHLMIVNLRELFVLQNTFHWIKSITVTTRQGQQISAGHFKPLQSRRYITDCHEFVFHLTHMGTVPLQRLALGVPYSDKSNIARWAHTNGRDLRCRGNNWFIPYRTILSRSKERPHPATFPVELAANCIRLHGCRPDLVVLDPFVGIGHSALAAQECGVGRFFGFDIDPDYVEVAKAALVNGTTTPTPALAKTMRSRRKKDGGRQPTFEEGLF
jgi:site-specific DNA-methyltransferase (adenine-specific)